MVKRLLVLNPVIAAASNSEKRLVVEKLLIQKEIKAYIWMDVVYALKLKQFYKGWEEAFNTIAKVLQPIGPRERLLNKLYKT